MCRVTLRPPRPLLNAYCARSRKPAASSATLIFHSAFCVLPVFGLHIPLAHVPCQTHVHSPELAFPCSSGRSPVLANQALHGRDGRARSAIRTRAAPSGGQIAESQASIGEACMSSRARDAAIPGTTATCDSGTGASATAPGPAGRCKVPGQRDDRFTDVRVRYQRHGHDEKDNECTVQLTRQ